MGKVLHASGSGYFLGCIQESTDSKYAVWSLEKAMQTYWRVRTWTFAANGIERVYDFPEEGENTDFPFATTLGDITSGNNEETGLVCGNSFFADNSFGYDFYSEIDFDVPRRVDDLYDSGIIGFVVDGERNVEYGFSAEISSPFTLSILGATIPIDVELIAPNEEYLTEIISCSATLTPTLWWSYGGTYDTATGAPL